jgi:hypothetical protein
MSVLGLLPVLSVLSALSSLPRYRQSTNSVMGPTSLFDQIHALADHSGTQIQSRYQIIRTIGIGAYGYVQRDHSVLARAIRVSQANSLLSPREHIGTYTGK